MKEIEFFDLGYCDESEYTRVVCVSKYKDDFIFCFNTKRNGWEIPGGHIEEGETWIDACKREMYEETGATRIEVEPISVYKINSFALLCYCEVLELREIPKEYEMSEIMLSKELPDNLTYPDTYRKQFELVKKKKKL